MSQTEGRGLRLALIAPQTRGPSGEHVNAVIEHLPPGVEVFLVREEGFRADPRAAEGVRFAKAGSKRRSAFQVANPVRAELIARKVLRWRPDVVHLFNGEGYPWALWWVVRFGRAGVPFVLTLHDATPHIGNPVEAMTARVRGPVVRRASAIQVHAEQFVPIVRAMTSAPTEVIPHGSFAAPYLKHARRGGADRDSVLMFGRLEAYKGIDVLVDAADRLPPSLKVVIAGPGRLPEPLERRIRSDPERFELHNSFLSDETVAGLFERAAVCALPYRHVSQSSLPLIAAAFGVPVVASNLGAFATDVPAVNGILVPPDDPAALASALVAAIGRQPIDPPELSYAQLGPRYAAWYERARAAAAADRGG